MILEAGALSASRKAGDCVAAHLVVRKLGTDHERIVTRCSQQPVVTQSSEGGGIEPADDIKPFAAAERASGQFEEHQLPRIWRPPVRHLAPTNEPGPHFSHRICIVQWDAGEMASNEQVNHYEPTQEFARPRVGIEVAQLREGLDNFVYFSVGQTGPRHTP